MKCADLLSQGAVAFSYSDCTCLHCLLHGLDLVLERQSRALHKLIVSGQLLAAYLHRDLLINNDLPLLKNQLRVSLCAARLLDLDNKLIKIGSH